MNKDKHYKYVVENFPNHSHIFSNIVGDKILIYDFEIEDLGFIEFLYENFPLVIVVTNSFDKYQYAKEVLDNHTFVILQEVTNTDIISYQFDTVIMFNTLSNIRNQVLNNVPLKNLQTVIGANRHMDMTYASVIKQFLIDINSKINTNGKLIIKDFNYVDSDEYDIISSIILDDKYSYLLDRFLDLRINRGIDLNIIKTSQEWTSFVGAYQHIYSFLTTKVRIGHEIKPIYELIDKKGTINDVSRDSFMLCGVISAESWKYLLESSFGFSDVKITTKLSTELKNFVEISNFNGLNRLSEVIDDDIMTIVATKRG